MHWNLSWVWFLNFVRTVNLCRWTAECAHSFYLNYAVPPWLTAITQRISEQTGLFPSPINHVLINEYLPDQGIMVCGQKHLYFLLLTNQRWQISAFCWSFDIILVLLVYLVYWYKALILPLPCFLQWSLLLPNKKMGVFNCLDVLFFT